MTPQRAEETDRPLDPAAEARLDAALTPAPLSPALRERLEALAPAATPAGAVAGRIGFSRGRTLAAGLAAAAALGMAAWLAAPADRPNGGAIASGPADPPAPIVDEADDFPALRALADAAAATGLLADPDASPPAPGTAEHRLAELEAAAGDPWARSAWAAVEADALFADGPHSPSLF